MAPRGVLTAVFSFISESNARKKGQFLHFSIENRRKKRENRTERWERIIVVPITATLSHAEKNAKMSKQMGGSDQKREKNEGNERTNERI